MYMVNKFNIQSTVPIHPKFIEFCFGVCNSIAHPVNTRRYFFHSFGCRSTYTAGFSIWTLILRAGSEKQKFEVGMNDNLKI